MRPASSLSVRCPSPTPSLRHSARPRCRVDDLRLPELVRHHADVAHPDAVREAGAERLDDRFLGREAHREKAHGPFRFREQRELFVEQHAAREVLAEALPGPLDALGLQICRCRYRRSRARSHHERLHFGDGAREAVEQRLRDDRVPDVELDDRRRSPQPA